MSLVLLCITSVHPRDPQVIQQQTHDVIHANIISGKRLHNLICPRGRSRKFSQVSTVGRSLTLVFSGHLLLLK